MMVQKQKWRVREMVNDNTDATQWKVPETVNDGKETI